MQWVRDLKTGTKLSLCFGFIIILMIIIIASSYISIHHLKKAMQSFSHNELTLLEKITKLRDNESDLQASNLMLFHTKDPVKLAALRQTIKETIADNNNLSQQIMMLGENNPQFIASFSAVDRLRKTVEDYEAANLMNNGSVAGTVSESNMENYDKLGNLTLHLIADVQNAANSKIAEASRIATHAATLSIILGILSVILVFFLVLMLNKLIVDPLKNITTTAQTIASGDILKAQLNSVARKDEIGMLSSAFLNMVEWLKSVAETAKQISEGDLTVDPILKSQGDILGKAFKKMIQNLRQITSQISEAMHLLETSMNEISAATSQLVSSASETATAISETTSTIEEVKQTSRTANEKAKIISDSAKKTNDISATGNKTASEMTDMTNQIKNQMQLIAESMLRLSEQGQAIGLIMATVEDMAQQSNLLSVNASIEAAKAGEQGRGFSIVAQEVKTLASQSKQATNQVRDILNDIQKATSSAVMATEQGSKAVELGVKKSEETGQSIGTLVKIATESARDAMQIAATTHQQLIGMEQAATAMENIKTATLQNVEGSKQLEAAALNIKELGSKLKQLISQYKIQKSGNNSNNE